MRRRILETCGVVPMPSDDRVFGGPIELDEAFYLRSKDPKRALEICERYIDKHPDDPNGFNERAEIFFVLGENEKAERDFDIALALDPHYGRYSVRGDFFRRIGKYQRGIDDMTRARELDEEAWVTSLAPIVRADCYAHLGRLDEALADCTLIPDDWWMPAFDDFPGGNKEEIIEEIKQRALSAREKKESP